MAASLALGLAEAVSLGLALGAAAAEVLVVVDGLLEAESDDPPQAAVERARPAAAASTRMRFMT
ncbi:MAG TPA: hypothetical protein VE781_03115 [Kineosporiaceae bacterium]|jgi:hypothetical protein|nr:hypothetical protein [Kineosporiaceae bacterium]